MPIIQTERYDIDPKPLGKGGFGETHTARDLLFDRDVVIKTILASRLYGIDEPAFRRQFFREALVSAKLGHQTDRIVKVLDYGYDRDSDLPFFVMEKLEGGDLSSRVGRMLISDAIRVFSDVLIGLAVAHEHGVIHSDISPDNILFDPRSGIYKVNDFGLAKLLTSALMSRGASISLTGGKPGYLPIDQWHSGERNQASDLYGLAVTIVELVTGKVPRWILDFKSGKMTPPDLRGLFSLEQDEVVLDHLFDRESSFPFGVSAIEAGFPEWRAKARGSFYRYWSNVTTSDFLDTLTAIITGKITETKSVQPFIIDRSINRIRPIEHSWRENQRIKNEVKTRQKTAPPKTTEGGSDTVNSPKTGTSGIADV